MTHSPFIIFDTEFTAWEGSWQNNWSKPHEHREIIQIAAAIIDPSDQYQIQAEFDVLVKAIINPQLSDYIQQLTGISQEQIDQHGIDFQHAIVLFYDFCKQNSMRAYCWGADEDAFIETCQLNNLKFSNYFNHFYDIRHVLNASGIDTTKYQSGNCYQSVGLEFHQKQHNALNDVKSIAITLQYLLQKDRLVASSFLNCPISGTNSCRS